MQTVSKHRTSTGQTLGKDTVPCSIFADPIVLDFVRFTLDLCWIYVGFMLDNVGLRWTHVLDSCWIRVGLCWVYVGFVLGLCWMYVGFMLDSCRIDAGLMLG